MVNLQPIKKKALISLTPARDLHLKIIIEELSRDRSGWLIADDFTFLSEKQKIT